jgi:hypothetical protein
MGSENTIRTEFNFILPRGLVDDRGGVHRQGVMRLATAKDELYVQKDSRVQQDSAYGVLVMLSRVITRLGSISSITPELLEELFTRDLAYLREFYNRINQQGNAYLPVQCPQCSSQFNVELSLSGES